MSWSFIASGATGNGNNAASVSPGLPAGWAAGDLHVMVFSNFGGTNSRRASLPAGWTSIGGDTGWLNGTTNCAIYYRVAQSGDTAPTITLTGTGAASDTQLSRIHGFRSTAGVPTLRTSGSTSTNASADDVGAITTMTPTAGDLALIVAAKSNDWNGTATLASWTLATQNESTTGNDAGNALLYVLSWGGGATGSLTVTDNGGTASAGVGLGIQAAFYEVPVAPTVTTQAVSAISTVTATGNGNVTSDGGSTITERGVCWKTSTGPTTADSKATASGTTGAYTASMTSLASRTHYYVRAYAINAIGTSYGAEVEFDTLPVFADIRQDIITGLDSAQAEGTGWDAVVKAGQTVAGVVRTSDTVVTITLDAFASYNITAQETITATVPAIAVAGAAPLVATPSFTIDPTAGSVTVTPGVGVLTLTGLAPTVQTPRNVTPDVGALTLSGFAPTVSTPLNLTPGVGALTLAGLAPTVVATANVNVTPGVGALTLTGLAPTVQTPRNVTPDVGALTLSGLAPTVTVSAGTTVLPGTGVLTLDGLAPTVQTPRNVAPGTGVLALDGYAPTVSVSTGANVEVLPGTGDLTLDGYAPVVSVSTNAVTPTDTGGGDRAKFGPTGGRRKRYRYDEPQPVYRWPVGMAPLGGIEPARPIRRAKPLPVVVPEPVVAAPIASARRVVQDERAQRDARRTAAKQFAALDAIDTQLATLEEQRHETVRLRLAAEQRVLTAERQQRDARTAERKADAERAWQAVEQLRMETEAAQARDAADLQDILAILDAITD